jgi:hypothetical protein
MTMRRRERPKQGALCYLCDRRMRRLQPAGVCRACLERLPPVHYGGQGRQVHCAAAHLEALAARAAAGLPVLVPGLPPRWEGGEA